MIAKREPRSDLIRTVIFALVASLALLFSDQLGSMSGRRSPVLTVVVAVVVLAWWVVPGVLKRDAFELGIAAAIAPGMASMVAKSVVDPDPRWAAYARAASLVLLVVVVFTFALLFTRRTRELDRFLFSEATSIAFFVTLAAAAAYAGSEALIDVPRLSFAWIPLFGLTIWGIVAVLLWKRYS